MHTSPLDVEIATATDVVVATALATLRDRPAVQCDLCGALGPFTRERNFPGSWRGQHCYWGTFRARPPRR